MKTKVKFYDIEDIKNFVRDCGCFECEIAFISGRYVIDAKSIMGVFSLDLSEPKDIEIFTEDIPTLEKFKEIVEEYEVDK